MEGGGVVHPSHLLARARVGGGRLGTPCCSWVPTPPGPATLVLPCPLAVLPLPSVSSVPLCEHRPLTPPCLYVSSSC